MKSMIRAVVCCMLAPLVLAQQPYEKPDESWISISGEVESADDDSFVLDYGQKNIIVEMDDWDWYGDNAGVMAGDKVTVYGRVDAGFYDLTTIEAGSVYVENLGTYFYANPADEEEAVFLDWLPQAPIEVGDITLTGTVTSVSGREFTIDTGERQMKVDTLQMPYDPMDDEGFQKIETGDVVSVTGNLDIDTFEKREIMAETIITLDDSEKRAE